MSPKKTCPVPFQAGIVAGAVPPDGFPVLPDRKHDVPTVEAAAVFVDVEHHLRGSHDEQIGEAVTRDVVNEKTAPLRDPRHGLHLCRSAGALEARASRAVVQSRRARPERSVAVTNPVFEPGRSVYVPPWR